MDDVIRWGLRALIVQHGGGDSALHATGAARVGATLVRAFGDIVGADGALALFERSVAVAEREKPSPLHPPWAWSLARAGWQRPDVALEASVRVLASFLEQLGVVIGDALVLRVLRERWPIEFAAAGTA